MKDYSTPHTTRPGQWGAAARIPGRFDSARVSDSGRELAVLKTVMQQQQAQLEQLSRSVEELRSRVDVQAVLADGH